MKAIISLGMAALLAGCATGETELEAPRAAGDVIRFTAGRCFGACPAYTLRVTPDGSGLLEPERFTAVPGPTRFTITRAQYQRLRAALAPYRPAAGVTKTITQGQADCQRFATDMPGYSIEWSRGAQKPARLDYQSGCMDTRHARLRSTIRALPAMLGIEAMLKPKAAS